MAPSRLLIRPTRVAAVSASLSLLLVTAGSLPPPAATLAAPAWDLAHVGPFTFRMSPFSVRLVPAELLPMEGSTLVTPDGEEMPGGYELFWTQDGALVDHPVGQAQCVVNLLRNARLSGDPRYLQRAIANAERLLARADHVGDALFFPYPFDWPLHGRGTLRPPWYSGMAQGIALAGFVRLFERTGDPRWEVAADATFASFLAAENPGQPWVTTVDGELLWFEEYPWQPADHTFNGHVFALYGLYDYWRLTGDRRAELLVRGGLATAEVAATLVRVPGEVSRYCVSRSCLDRDVRNPAYHGVHIGQFRTLYRITGQEVFDELADALAADHA